MDPYIAAMNADIQRGDAARAEEQEWREIFAMADYTDGATLTIKHLCFSIDALRMIPAGARKQYLIDSSRK